MTQAIMPHGEGHSPSTIAARRVVTVGSALYTAAGAVYDTVDAVRKKAATVDGLEKTLAVVQRFFEGFAAYVNPGRVLQMTNIAHFAQAGRDFCSFSGLLSDVTALASGTYLSGVRAVAGSKIKQIFVHMQNLSGTLLNISVPLSILQAKQFIVLSPLLNTLVKRINVIVTPIFFTFKITYELYKMSQLDSDASMNNLINYSMKLTLYMLPLLLVPAPVRLGMLFASAAFDYYTYVAPETNI